MVGIGQPKQFFSGIVNEAGGEYTPKFRFTRYDESLHTAWEHVYSDEGQGISQITGPIDTGGGDYYEWTSGSWWDWLLAQDKTPVVADITNLSDNDNGSDAGVITFDTSKNSGTIYVAITTTNTPLSVADLKSGTGAVYSANQAVTTYGAQTFNVLGLASETNYYAQVVHNTTEGDSVVVVGDGFTTPASGFSGRVLMNFSYTETVTNPDTNTNHWNNVLSGDIPNNYANNDHDPYAFGELNDTDGNPSGISFTKALGMDGDFGDDTGSNDLGVNGPVGDYVDPAPLGAWYSYLANEGEWSFTGLDNTKSYTFKFWGARGQGATGTRRIQIDTLDDFSTAQEYEGLNNNDPNQNAEFVITGDTEITFYLRTKPGDTFGYVGVVDITEN